MSHRSVSAKHHCWLIAITVFLLTACANQAAPTAAPLALSSVAVTQTAPAAQANQPLPVTATSTPEPTPTSTSAPTATAPPPSPNPTATFTPAPPEPPAVAAATPPEVTPGVEFAIERKTIEAPDGSKLEVLTWTTGKLEISFEVAFAEEAYTFGLDGSRKEAGAILMPGPDVSWDEIRGRFENLVNVVVGAKLGLVDTSKPIPRAKLEEIKKYLAEYPDASYEVRSGGKVVGSVKANAPIRYIILKPQLFARDTMKAGFDKLEAAKMSPLTISRALAKDEGRLQHKRGPNGKLEILFEPFLGKGDGILLLSDQYWPWALLTMSAYEAAGALDFGFSGQSYELQAANIFNGTVAMGQGWRANEALFREDGMPPKKPVLKWARPAD